MILPAVYVFLSFSTEDSTRLLEEEEIVTEAPDSRDASATQNPIPVHRQNLSLSMKS
jgi:hypothetical protein